MTVSYSLGPNPIWNFTDVDGKPLGGGYLATQDGLNPNIEKPVYQDAGGVNVWPYVSIPNQPGKLGILINEDGTQGPFYFKFDSLNSSDFYNLYVFDENGVPRWNAFYPWNGAGGGGGSVTNYINIKNYVVNNYFWRNIGTLATISTTYNVVAPGVNTGLAKTSATTYGPDIVFIKDNNSATDSLSFPTFTPAHSADLAPDVTPPYCFNYACTGAGTETKKILQIPISHNVTTFSGLQVTVSFYGIFNSGNGNTVSLQFVQFFGDGPSASTPIVTSIGTYTLTGGWAAYPSTITIPSVTTGPNNVIGECGNDGLFLQILFPTVAPITNISITKPVLYLALAGAVNPQQQFTSPDEINSIIDSPRTGDIRIALNSFNAYGWLPMNDGTIGSSTSGATTRANTDTFPLYNLLWTAVSDTYAPVSGGRGASAVADFVANKAIKLTLALGRVLATSGQGSGLSNWALGQTTGGETFTLTTTNLPPHAHTVGTGIAGGDPLHIQGGGSASTVISTTGTTGANSTPFGIMQPTTFMLTYIKL